MSVRNLEAVLSPTSIALIGASERPGSLGAVVNERLVHAGFDGAIHLVNPKHSRIAGRPCFASIADIPGAVDLGIIVTPARTVPGLVAELGAKGARGAIVISAGIDKTLRRKMLDAARPYCLRVLGPNCLGLQVPAIGLDASFAHLTPKAGNLALLSQSGAIVTAMIDWAETRDVGFSVTASMGDMADIDVGDLLDYLAQDRRTHAILMYLEHVTDARKFMSAARAAARVKPVIAIKAGRSADAARAAASHTGALMGADEVYDAAFRRAGILRVDDLGDLFDAAETLARHKTVRGDRLTVLTNGGGGGVLAADAVANEGLQLSVLSGRTMDALDALLPSNWSRGNPVDIIGDAGPDRFEAALDAVLADEASDAVLVINCPTGLASSRDAAIAITNTLQRRPAPVGRKTPVFTSWMGGATALQGNAILSEAGLPVYRTPGQAVKGFGYLHRHRALQRQLMRAPKGLGDEAPADREAALQIVNDCLRSGRDMLTEPEAHSVLAAYGIPAVETRVASSPEEAEAVASDLLSSDRRVDQLVLKVLSQDISHKSDVGGVRLGLLSPQQISDAASEMQSHIAVMKPGARIDGFVVQPMIQRKNAHELIAGLSIDRVFGPVLMIGAGGTSVEVVADKALALPPLDHLLAMDMIDRTRIAKLLDGYRDRPAADKDAIVDVLVKLSHLSANIPEIVELDINPLLANEDGVIALDARLRVEPAPAHREGQNPRFAIRPYPVQWDQMIETPGGALRLRPIRPADEALYPAFIDRLSKRDIRFRFFGFFSNPSHEQIAQFTQIDYARAMAFVALDPEDGALLGVSRLSADPDNERAEFAILIRSDRQGRGIGRALMRQLIDYARASKIGLLFGDVMEENDSMLQMCQAFGFARETDPEDAEVKRVTLRLHKPRA